MVGPSECEHAVVDSLLPHRLVAAGSEVAAGDVETPSSDAHHCCSPFCVGGVGAAELRQPSAVNNQG
eukprot:10660804-Prorocentrum_lima.AAC.1